MSKIRFQAPAALNGKARQAAAQQAMRSLMTAQQHGWKATEGPHATWFVPSASQPQIARTVRIMTAVDGHLVFVCSCVSGYYRQGDPVPCWHSAAVLSKLYADKRVTPDNGLVIWSKP